MHIVHHLCAWIITLVVIARELSCYVFGYVEYVSGYVNWAGKMLFYEQYHTSG